MSQKPVLDGVERRRASDEAGTDAWIDNEVVGCEFEDVRHGKRLRQLLEQLSSKVGAATPWACQDWANTKAAYRFFGNERISESNILAGHFACTRERFSASRGFPLLVLHDTTELSYRHEDTASIGILKKIPAGHKGRAGLYTSCGIMPILGSYRPATPHPYKRRSRRIVNRHNQSLSKKAKQSFSYRTVRKH